MKRKSLEGIDLSALIKNSGVGSLDIEVLYRNEISIVVNANHENDTICYLIDEGGHVTWAFKKDCVPTVKGVKKIKKLKKAANKMSGFKNGDWILYKGELAQIQKMRDGHIQQLGDGTFNYAGYELNEYCFNLTPSRKRVSEEFIEKMMQIMNSSIKGLNYSNVYKIFINFWKELMLCSDNQDEINILLKELNFFCKALWGGPTYRLKSYCGINVRY